MASTDGKLILQQVLALTIYRRTSNKDRILSTFGNNPVLAVLRAMGDDFLPSWPSEHLQRDRSKDVLTGSIGISGCFCVNFVDKIGILDGAIRRNRVSFF